MKRWGRLVARHLALEVLSRACSNRSKEMMSVPRVHFLHFHHVYENEIDAFSRFMEWLISNDAQFITHSEAVQKSKQEKIDRVYVSVSFDDGLKSCLTASKIMDEYGAKGCFFINGEVIGNVDLHESFSRFRLKMHNQDFMDWADIADLVNRGHEIGNHTFSHHNCSEVSLEMFEADFKKNHALICDHVDEPRHFAWPYGGAVDVKDSQLDLVYRLGYQSACYGIRGCHVNKESSDHQYIFREHCVASWPISHIEYFMADSVIRALGKNW